MSIVKLHCRDLWHILVFDTGYNSSDCSFILYVVLYYSNQRNGCEALSLAKWGALSVFYSNYSISN